MLAPLPQTTLDSPSHGGKTENSLSSPTVPSLTIGSESSQSMPKQPVLLEIPSKSSLPLGSETSQSTPKQPVVPLLSSHAIGSESSQATLKQSVVPVVPPKGDPSLLLASLRHNLQRSEQELYVQLSQTSTSSLNDVRRAFLATAKGTQKRILAWQKKHLASKASPVGELSAEEPEWWEKGCHAVPGANIIIRERDWGSIIAFTLRWVLSELFVQVEADILIQHFRLSPRARQPLDSTKGIFTTNSSDRKNPLHFRTIILLFDRHWIQAFLVFLECPT